VFGIDLGGDVFKRPSRRANMALDVRVGEEAGGDGHQRPIGEACEREFVGRNGAVAPSEMSAEEREHVVRKRGFRDGGERLRANERAFHERRQALANGRGAEHVLDFAAPAARDGQRHARSRELVPAGPVVEQRRRRRVRHCVHDLARDVDFRSARSFDGGRPSRVRLRVERAHPAFRPDDRETDLVLAGVVVRDRLELRPVREMRQRPVERRRVLDEMHVLVKQHERGPRAGERAALERVRDLRAQAQDEAAAAICAEHVFVVGGARAGILAGHDGSLGRLAESSH
jgi:hypothetical protein